MRALFLAPVFLILAACSHDESIHAESTGATGTGGHKMQGAGGASSTATSGTGGAGAGSCCSEPVHVAGDVKVMGADTDPKQQISGSATTMSGKLVDGPVFVTDFVGNGTAWLTSNGTCDIQVNPTVIDSGLRDFHGLRLFVPAGKTLCSLADDRIWFSGFRPY